MEKYGPCTVVPLSFIMTLNPLSVLSYFVSLTDYFLKTKINNVIMSLGSDKIVPLVSLHLENKPQAPTLGRLSPFTLLFFT